LSIALGAAAPLGCAGGCGRHGSADPTGAGEDPPAAAARVEIDLFAFGRVLGTVAPCGCTTEPLGGMQYAFGYLERQSQAGRRLVLEPGSFLFPDPAGPEWPADEAAWEQARARANGLVARFGALGDELVSGVGPTDAASPEGADAIAKLGLPRIVANAEAGPLAALPRHRIATIAGDPLRVDVGLTAVVDPSLPGADALGKLTAPDAALRREAAAMREAGADIVVAMVQGPRALAEQLAQDVAGLDVVVVGRADGLERARLGSPAAQVGGAWVVEPGEQLQTVTHLTLSIAPGVKELPPASAWTLLPSRSDREAELRRVEKRLAQFERDPGADASFVARLRAERDALRAGLDGAPTATGDVVATFEQVKITCRLPVDDGAKQELARYDEGVAAANLARFTGVVPPAPKKGKPGYAGMDACNDCHEEAVKMWHTTVHAGAWETLEQDNKTLDLSCVSCHVTGFRKPGGSEVVENAKLRDVQCEVCHGPGSIHVEDPRTDNIVLDAPADVCLQCHTPEHSDTFQYEAYLRDVVGEGHGPKRRTALGAGATGRELRSAGLAKAGGSCKKM
jgi:hypothetical protein